MKGKYIDIAADGGGKFRGYLCTPPAGKGPGLVVIQEIFGINANVRAVCENYATEGFVTLAPDLFWRMEPNVDLDYTEAGWARAFDFFKRFDVNKGVEDIDAALNHLYGMAECAGRVGAIGYCLGGKLAYLAATRTPVDASVGYYGVGIEASLDEKANIGKPLLLHIAEKDQFVPPEAQAKVKSGLAGVKGVEIYSYAGADHAFARIGGDHFDRKSAELANARTLAFLKKNLA